MEEKSRLGQGSNCVKHRNGGLGDARLKFNNIKFSDPDEFEHEMILIESMVSVSLVRIDKFEEND